MTEAEEKLEQFDRDAAQLLITLECTAGESHWITLLYKNTLARIRKVLVRELHECSQCTCIRDHPDYCQKHAA